MLDDRRRARRPARRGAAVRAGLVLFALASAASALAPDVGWLIASRAVQGVGAAFVMPLGLALLSAAFPPERRGTAIGMFSAITGLAVASGPLRRRRGRRRDRLDVDLLAQRPDRPARCSRSCWRGARRASAPTPPSTSAGLRPRDGRRARHRLGRWCAATRPAGASVEVVATLAGGRCSSVAFVAWERRASEPMLPMSFFRSRAFSAGNVGDLLRVRLAVRGGLLLLPAAADRPRLRRRSRPGLRLMPWTGDVPAGRPDRRRAGGPDRRAAADGHRAADPGRGGIDLDRADRRAPA